MKYEWELVSDDGHVIVKRLRIPRTGWLVNSLDKEDKLFSSCFIPDSSNQWNLNEEKHN